MKIPRITATALLSCIGCTTAFPAWAALTLDSADWNGRQLVAGGTGDRGDTVTVTNAYATAQVLGSSNIGGNGRWTVRANRPDPVPCAITASAPARRA